MATRVERQCFSRLRAEKPSQKVTGEGCVQRAVTRQLREPSERRLRSGAAQRRRGAQNRVWQEDAAVDDGHEAEGHGREAVGQLRATKCRGQPHPHFIEGWPRAQRPKQGPGREGKRAGKQTKGRQKERAAKELRKRAAPYGAPTRGPLQGSTEPPMQAARTVERDTARTRLPSSATRNAACCIYKRRLTAVAGRIREAERRKQIWAAAGASTASHVRTCVRTLPKGRPGSSLSHHPSSCRNWAPHPSEVADG